MNVVTHVWRGVAFSSSNRQRLGIKESINTVLLSAAYEVLFSSCLRTPQEESKMQVSTPNLLHLL